MAILQFVNHSSTAREQWSVFLWWRPAAVSVAPVPGWLNSAGAFILTDLLGRAFNWAASLHTRSARTEGARPRCRPQPPWGLPLFGTKMSTEIKRLEFELEKASNGLAMPYDRERVWQLEAQLREARQRVRMRKAKHMAAKLRLKLSK